MPNFAFEAEAVRQRTILIAVAAPLNNTLGISVST